MLFGAVIVLVCIRLSQPDVLPDRPVPRSVALPEAGLEAGNETESGTDDDKATIRLNQPDVRPDLPVPVPQPPGIELPQIMFFEPETLSPHEETPDTGPLRKTRYAEPVPKLPALPNRNKNLSEKIMIKTLPALFSGEEGSYSDVTELFGGNSPRSTDLRSDWMTKHLLPGRNLPLLRMRILQDPFTGEYRISGGAVALPGTGLEAGYETESGTDDYKTTLQWKKSF